MLQVSILKEASRPNKKQSWAIEDLSENSGNVMENSLISDA